jgi:hypothetical protein
MVLDFKDCARQVISNRSKDANGEVVQWNKVHVFQYRKETPDKIYFKYEDDEDFKSMCIHGRRRNRAEGSSLIEYPLKQLYGCLKQSIGDKSSLWLL